MADKKIRLYKKYSDGKVKHLDIAETKDNVMHMLSQGFFLTEEEAENGKLAPGEPENKEPENKAPAKKAPVKKVATVKK